MISDTSKELCNIRVNFSDIKIENQYINCEIKSLDKFSEDKYNNNVDYDDDEF